MPTITISPDPPGAVSVHLDGPVPLSPLIDVLIRVVSRLMQAEPAYEEYPDDTLAPDDLRGCAWGYDPDAPDQLPEDRAEPVQYPAADYLCLECGVDPDCDPQNPLCEWKQNHHRAMGPLTYEIVHAVEVLQQRGSKVGGSAIAALLDRTRSGIHGRIKRVAEMGLIEKTGATKGGRIRLTDAGRAFLEGYKRR